MFIKKIMAAASFSVILFGINAYAAVGDVLGDVYSTDISAYMDGAPIASYNIGGRTVIKAADLRDYGFDVTFDEENRIAYVTAVSRPEVLPSEISDTGKGEPGKVIGKYLETDITCWVNGMSVDSYNIDGSTMIVTEDMGNMEKIMSRDGNIHSDLGYAPSCVKMEWDETGRRVLLNAIHPRDNISTENGDFKILGDKLIVENGYFPMGYDLYKDSKGESVASWVQGISPDGMYLELNALMEALGMDYSLDGNTVNLNNVNADEIYLRYSQSGAANGGVTNVIFPLDINLSLNGEPYENEGIVFAYEYRGQILVSVKYLNAAFGAECIKALGALPEGIGEPIAKIHGTYDIVSVNHKNINSYFCSDGKTYVSADDLAKCGFNVKYSGNKVEITKPEVIPETTQEDYEKPETSSYGELKNLFDVYKGVYDVTVDGVDIDDVYIDGMLTIDTPCIAIEDLASIEGYTVEKKEGYINLYTK